MKKKKMSPGEQRFVNLLFDLVDKWLNGEGRESGLEIMIEHFKRRKLIGHFNVKYTRNDDPFEIKIESQEKDPERILLHEALHGLFMWNASDHKIFALDRLLWNRLSEDQKAILRSYLSKKGRKKRRL